MGVGVEEAFHEDLAVVALEQLPGRLGALRPGRNVSYRDAGDLLKHEQPARRKLLVDPGRAEARKRAESRSQALHVLGLELEIELAPERVREVLDRGGEVDDLAQRHAVPGL